MTRPDPVRGRGHTRHVTRRSPFTRALLGGVHSIGLTDLTLSCAAGPACRSRSGAPVAANDVRRTEWRTATGVTPSRFGEGRQLGCRAEAGPHQLQREVRRLVTRFRASSQCRYGMHPR
jgi:hypothetical protein